MLLCINKRMWRYVVTFLLLFWCKYVLGVGVNNYQVIDIDLANYEPQRNGSQVYKYLDILIEGSAVVTVGNVSQNVGYFVIQLHSYLEPVSLSYNAVVTKTNFVNGTNIGLVQIHSIGTNSYEFYVRAPSRVVPVMFVVIAYTKETPVPGGCNMVFNTEIAPYQRATWADDLIQVNAEAPSAPNVACALSNINVEFYHMFLREKDNSKENYFKGIEKMLSVDDVRTNGQKVSVPPPPFRRYYNSYSGTGVVIAIIATYGNYSSAYVPVVSYGCDVSNWDESCNGPGSVLWKLICASLLFLGAFVCYLGHGFFRTTLFLAGFAFGTFVTHVILFGVYALSSGQALTVACIFGGIYGAFWLLLWWKFGIPVLSIYLAFFLSGVVISAMLFYGLLGDFLIFRNDLCYWLTVCCICFTYSIILTGVAKLGHIIVCSFLGSYALITALSIYVGANLHYIVINLYRRATIPHFDLAVVDPPFQDRDINLTVSWFLFFVSGVCVQCWFQRGRPPFPPHRSGRQGEYQPLLEEPRIGYSSLRVF